MALRLDQKKALVAQVNEVANSAMSAVAAEYSGLTVEQMTQLRAKAHESGRICEEWSRTRLHVGLWRGPNSTA